MYITTEIQDAVEIITIDRPKALNALNPEVLEELKAAFEAVDQNVIRCIVLTGAGEKSFVAGADIASMSTMTKAEGEAFGKLGNDIFLMIEKFPIPVIAAVNGFALGGGKILHSLLHSFVDLFAVGFHGFIPVVLREHLVPSAQPRRHDEARSGVPQGVPDMSRFDSLAL